jgi:ABC-type transporter Mla subunit MlaD
MVVAFCVATAAMSSRSRAATSASPLVRHTKETTMSKIDDAADKVKNATDKTADAAKDAAKQTGEKIQEAGKAIKKQG